MKVSYNPKLANHVGSVVAAILFTYLYEECKEVGSYYYESSGLKSHLGFSEPEYQSAVNILQSIGAILISSGDGIVVRYELNPLFFNKEV